MANTRCTYFAFLVTIVIFWNSSDALAQRCYFGECEQPPSRQAAPTTPNQKAIITGGSGYGFGALAHDTNSGMYGLSSNESTQAAADNRAIAICGSPTCKLVFQTAARECGAVATAEMGNAWGAGKQPQRAAAELDAISNCQKRTRGQCALRGSACN
jgi:hypothetical protein